MFSSHTIGNKHMILWLIDGNFLQNDKSSTLSRFFLSRFSSSVNKTDSFESAFDCSSSVSFSSEESVEWSSSSSSLDLLESTTYGRAIVNKIDPTRKPITTRKLHTTKNVFNTSFCLFISFYGGHEGLLADKVFNLLDASHRRDLTRMKAMQTPRRLFTRIFSVKRKINEWNVSEELQVHLSKLLFKKWKKNKHVLELR